MYRPSLKSEVIDNQNPFMWCNTEINSDDSIDNLSIQNLKDSNEVQLYSNHPTAIVIVEPRRLESTDATATSAPSQAATSSSRRPEWFILPHTLDLHNDVLRLVSSLSTVVQILTRMTNAAAQELRQHPEREQGFEALRMLLNYADQMYTTLLQPQPSPTERLSSPRSSNTQSYSLFHHLFEPLLGLEDREEDSSSPRSIQGRITYRVDTASTDAVGPTTTDSTTGSSISSETSETNSN